MVLLSLNWSLLCVEDVYSTWAVVSSLYYNPIISLFQCILGDIVKCHLKCLLPLVWTASFAHYIVLTEPTLPPTMHRPAYSSHRRGCQLYFNVVVSSLCYNAIVNLLCYNSIVSALCVEDVYSTWAVEHSLHYERLSACWLATHWECSLLHGNRQSNLPQLDCSATVLQLNWKCSLCIGGHLYFHAAELSLLPCTCYIHNDDEVTWAVQMGIIW